MIPAKRFELLTKETNVGVASFNGLTSDSIFNLDENATKFLSASLSDLIESGTQSVVDVDFNIEDAVSSFAREAKDIAGAVVDFASMPQSVFDNFVGNIAGDNPQLEKTLRGVFKNCNQNGSMPGYGGRRYKNNSLCNGNQRSSGRYGTNKNCNSNNYRNMMNQMGGMNPKGGIFGDINAALSALIGLSNYGYGLGMCSVFDSFMNSKTFDNFGFGIPEYSKAAGAIMGTLGLSGDSLGWIDVAKTAASNLVPLQFNPGAIGDFFSNYSLSPSMGENDYTGFGNVTYETLDALDPEWYTSDLGSGLTIGPYAERSGTLAEITESVLSDRSFDFNNLDFAPDGDDDFVKAALCMF